VLFTIHHLVPMASTNLLQYKQELELAPATPENAQRLDVITELINSPLMALVPQAETIGGGIFFNRQGELGEGGFRALNEDYDGTLGNIDPQSAAMKEFGGSVKTDVGLIEQYGFGQHANQVNMKSQSMRIDYERTFIHGTEASNGGRGFNGIKALVKDSGQEIANHLTGGPLSIKALDEGLDELPPGVQAYIICSKAMRRIITRAEANTAISNVDRVMDEFGIQRETYGNAIIIPTDVDSRKNLIQGFDEPNDTTSIYLVTFGENYLTGLQGACRGQYGISVYDLPEGSAGPFLMTRIRWRLGLALKHSRSVVRIKNITKAEAVL
jgi:hypothetical protein